MAAPERWPDIDRVWHAVLARPEAERALALDELCDGDAALRRDLESLLGHLARASAAGFGTDGAPSSQPRRSLVGTTLGPYGIHKRIGAGGMGEVFQARDPVLERDVALKILPDVWMADADRRDRLDREARLLASLNHPNIGGIHGVEDAGGTPALVLELVDGDTLDEYLV
ncbi:MAG TPA: protein kinase, partial [Vicinamibacterales bacterium]|nr:protein kinase [Vicinamibacterales bacterium]